MCKTTSKNASFYRYDALGHKEYEDWTDTNDYAWSICQNELVTEEELNARNKSGNKRAYTRWQTRWNESVNGRVTFEYINDVRFGERNASLDPSVYVCFLTTGHGSLNAFLCEIKLNKSARFVWGAERKDWEHVLVECVSTEWIRTVCLMIGAQMLGVYCNTVLREMQENI